MAGFVRPQPRAIEMQYYRDWAEFFDDVAALVRSNIGQVDFIPGVRMDADVDEWSFTKAIRIGFDGIIAKITGRMTLRFEQLSHFNWVQWAREVKRNARYDLPEIRPWSEPGVEFQAQAWFQDNVALVTKVSAEVRSDLLAVVKDGVGAGLSREQLKRKILAEVPTLGAGRYRDVKTRASLIATDQILKANGDLTRQRMANAQVSYYRWQGMMDNRERHSHVALQNMVFRVDGKPMTDKDLEIVGTNGWQTMRLPTQSDPQATKPGTAVLCRCTMEAIFKGSVFDIGDEE